MTTIFFCRHGSVENPGDIFYGRLPGFHLSSEGKEEARKLGVSLKNEGISVLYSSPLERTMETAEIIRGELHIPTILKDDRILEVYTPIEGITFTELEKIDDDFYTNDYVSKGGESLEMVISRLMDFYIEVAKKHPGEKVAIVSHGDNMMITLLLSKGIVPKRKAEMIQDGYLPRGSAFEFGIDLHSNSLHFVRILPKND